MQERFRDGDVFVHRHWHQMKNRRGAAEDIQGHECLGQQMVDGIAFPQRYKIKRHSYCTDEQVGYR